MGLVMQASQQDTVEIQQQQRHIRIARGVLLTGPIVLALIQLIPGPSRVNPPVDIRETLATNVSMPAPVSAMLERACVNCHSNNTKWPWYTHLAPASWMVAKDVQDARKTMNFSRWSAQN